MQLQQEGRAELAAMGAPEPVLAYVQQLLARQYEQYRATLAMETHKCHDLQAHLKSIEVSWQPQHMLAHRTEEQRLGRLAALVCGSARLFILGMQLGRQPFDLMAMLWGTAATKRCLPGRRFILPESWPSVAVVGHSVCYAGKLCAGPEMDRGIVHKVHN